jgi:hypothetical protein
MVSEFWIPDLDDAPHVLLHGDLSGNNIIVDGRSVELTHQILVSSISVGQTWSHFNLQQNTPNSLRTSLTRLRVGSFGRDKTVS